MSDTYFLWGVMKMGNIAPRVGIEPTSLAFSVLAITPPRLPDVTALPTPTSIRGSLPETSVQTTILVQDHGHGNQCLGYVENEKYGV